MLRQKPGPHMYELGMLHPTTLSPTSTASDLNFENNNLSGVAGSYIQEAEVEGCCDFRGVTPY